MELTGNTTTKPLILEISINYADVALSMMLNGRVYVILLRIQPNLKIKESIDESEIDESEVLDFNEWSMQLLKILPEIRE